MNKLIILLIIFKVDNDMDWFALNDADLHLIGQKHLNIKDLKFLKTLKLIQAFLLRLIHYTLHLVILAMI